MLFDLTYQSSEPRIVFHETGPAIIPQTTRVEYTSCLNNSAMIVYQEVINDISVRINLITFNGIPIENDLIQWINQQEPIKKAYYISFSGCKVGKNGSESGILIDTLRWDSNQKQERTRYLISARGVREYAPYEH